MSMTVYFIIAVGCSSVKPSLPSSISLLFLSFLNISNLFPGHNTRLTQKKPRTSIRRLRQIFTRAWLRKAAAILQLPSEILSGILDFSLYNHKSVLQLAAGNFLEQFKDVLKHEEFRFPGIPSDGKTKCSEILKPSQTNILLRLQTKRWLYCSYCLKLHPRRELHSSERYKQPSVRCCGWPGIVVPVPVFD